MLELNGKLRLMVTDTDSTTGCFREMFDNGNFHIYYFKLNNKYDIEYVLNLTNNTYYDNSNISFNFRHALINLLDIDCVMMQ